MVRIALGCREKLHRETWQHQDNVPRAQAGRTFPHLPNVDVRRTTLDDLVPAFRISTELHRCGSHLEQKA